MERMETRFVREIARANNRAAALEQQVLRLQAEAAGVAPDAGLMGEWRGQEIAFKRMMNAIDGKDA